MSGEMEGRGNSRRRAYLKGRSQDGANDDETTRLRVETSRIGDQGEGR